MPELAFAAREYLARCGVTAQQVADHLGRPIDYILDQLTGEIPVRLDLVLALAVLTADSPEQVSAELASIAHTVVGGGSMRRALSQEIGAQRAALNLTQQQLADDVGETADRIAMYEAGLLDVSMEAVGRIAAALKTSPTILMLATAHRSGHDPHP